MDHTTTSAAAPRKTDTSVRLSHRVRAHHPALAAKADAGSRKAAIRLFCLECCNDNMGEVARCETTECSLWRFRVSGAALALEVADGPALNNRGAA